mmetsp:Transcript_48198/g.154384  ORF Transcript_48198/g.154384 Transcript_48198/m.154384 type:complete len:230 (+) Transcript_48198:312-1001(+)
MVCSDRRDSQPSAPIPMRSNSSATTARPLAMLVVHCWNLPWGRRHATEMRQMSVHISALESHLYAGGRASRAFIFSLTPCSTLFAAASSPLRMRNRVCRSSRCMPSCSTKGSPSPSSASSTADTCWRQPLSDALISASLPSSRSSCASHSESIACALASPPSRTTRWASWTHTLASSMEPSVTSALASRRLKWVCHGSAPALSSPFCCPTSLSALLATCFCMDTSPVVM